MSDSFLARLPLSRSGVDRDYLSRDNVNLFDELWADDSTRVLAVFEGKVLMRSATELELLKPAQVPVSDIRVYLGRTTTASGSAPIGTPIVAVLLTDEGEFADRDWLGLRIIGAKLSDRDAGLVTEALGMLNWHTTHRFSPRTGEPTVSEKGGWVRRDPVSDTENFPRTDSAIIVGVTDAEDRILLGSNAMWESNRFSLLAGFVEPGESFEAAVIREVFEESGVHVVNPRYLGSQPWPFPASIMVGFTATVDPAIPAEPKADGTEIRSLRWFSRDDIRANRGEILLPGGTSIAHAILEEWFGEPITDGIW